MATLTAFLTHHGLQGAAVNSPLRRAATQAFFNAQANANQLDALARSTGARALGTYLFANTAFRYMNLAKGLTDVASRDIVGPILRGRENRLLLQTASKEAMQLITGSRPVLMGLIGATGLAVGSIRFLAPWSKAKAGVWEEAEKLRQLVGGSIESIALHEDESKKVSIDDIIGQDTAKQATERTIDRLRELPDEPIKPLLFYGPPGTGKTLLAKAVASNLEDASFFVLKGSEVTDARVFTELKRQIEASPGDAVVFIDEIDSLAPKRGKEGESSSDRKITNGFLTLVEGVTEIDNRVLWIGATNHPRDLDAAALRRFPKHIEFTEPTPQDLKRLFELYLKDLTHAGTLDIKEIVKKSRGFVGSDVAAAVAILKEDILDPKNPKRFTQSQLLEAIARADKARKNRLPKGEAEALQNEDAWAEWEKSSPVFKPFTKSGQKGEKTFRLNNSNTGVVQDRVLRDARRQLQDLLGDSSSSTAPGALNRASTPEDHNPFQRISV